MHPRILELLEQQQRDGFPDLAGTDVTATIPISDRLITEVIAGLIPEGGKVRELTLTAAPGNLLTVKARLSGPSLLPSIPITLAIDEQPALPLHPVLALKLSQPSRFVAMAMSTLPAMVTLPAGVRIEGERILIDIRRLLTERNAEKWLDYVSSLAVTTRAGAVILNVRARIHPE